MFVDLVKIKIKSGRGGGSQTTDHTFSLLAVQFWGYDRSLLMPTPTAFCGIHMYHSCFSVADESFPQAQRPFQVDLIYVRNHSNHFEIHQRTGT